MDEDDEYQYQSDMSGVESAVNQVEAAVERVEQAVKDSKSEWGAILIGVVLVWGLWNWADEDLIHGKFRYEQQYGVPSESVMIAKKPHDCAFFTAPLGTKFCRYDRDVATEQTTMSQANFPIKSIDDGKTWEAFTPAYGETVPVRPKVRLVYVGWKKVEDD